MTEDYISLTEAAKRSPGRPHVASVWRWARRGVKTRGGERITLGHIRAGGKIFTTEQNLNDFFERVAEADAAHFAPKRQAPAPPTTDRKRQRSIELAEAELAEAGIIEGAK